MLFTPSEGPAAVVIPLTLPVRTGLRAIHCDKRGHERQTLWAVMTSLPVTSAASEEEDLINDTKLSIQLLS